MDLKVRCLLLFFTLHMQEGHAASPAADPGSSRLFQRVRRQSKATKPMLKVTDYHVRCSVVSRYAVTTVHSSVWNQLPVTKEAAFEVDLPSSAFISNFTITSNGKAYLGQVKERAAARKIYDAAKKQGKTAGLVATKEREIEKFRVAVSVPPGARMNFTLTYEELLSRRLGRYELSLGVKPGQLVENLTLDISISEQTGISFLKVLPLRTSRLLSNTAQGDASPPASTHVEQRHSCAQVLYCPSLQQQTSISEKGLSADFIIQYDVDLRDPIGEVQVHDGYFVHYFAPRGLPVVPKDVIFVIDISGSMIGTKIKQTKQAMATILGDLREGDHFNIITFSDKVQTWKRGRTVRATRQNVRDAKDFVRSISAEGWTNINAALLSAAQLINPSSSSFKYLAPNRVPLVIFLTDGEATIGVTAGDTILNNAKKALGSASLFGLAFGDDADFLLLKRLALDNRGVARMVYEDADAALQLKGFYDEVASPLLSDVQLSYLDEEAFDITRSLFPNYFQGSELVVAGKVKPGVKDLKVSMSATDAKQRVKFENDLFTSQALKNESAESFDCSAELDGISSFVHRLWAYFTIKELLLAKLSTTDAATQRLLTDKATNLSLKYNFVTPVTSLVVVKPDADEAAPTPMTARPNSAATTSTTATTTSATKVSAAGAAKRPASPFNHVSQKEKLNPPQPPSKRKTSTPKPRVSLSRKAATTPSPAPTANTAPAPFSGKKSSPSQPDSKTGSSLPPAAGGKMPTSLVSALKTASPPAPGRISSPKNSTFKTTTPTTGGAIPTHATSSSTPSIPVKSDLTTTRPEIPFTPQPDSLRPTPPAVKVTPPPAEREHSMSPPKEPEIDIGLTQLPALLTPPTPSVESNDTSFETDPSIATFVSETLIPMPGVTDGQHQWEAEGLLDVSTFIQRKDIDLVKDFDATYDYDYDLNYDAWGDTADTESFEPSSRLSTIRVFSSSVDGDPHFVVQLPKLNHNLCFTVDGRANDVLRLLEDPERGIIVDGHLVGAPSKHGVEERSRTYFDLLTISSGPGAFGEVTITLSLDTVVVEGEGRDILPVNQQGSVTRQGVTISVDHHQSCWIELARGVHFLVLFHQYEHPSYLQMAHMGFYIADGRGLSATTQGLLGQFQHADLSLAEVQDYTGRGVRKEAISARGVLRSGSEQVPVVLQDKTIKDTVQKRHADKCWVVPKAQVERLLGHPYESYVVDRV